MSGGLQGLEGRIEGALAEKLYAAERGIAQLRLMIVVAGWLSFPWLDTVPTLPGPGYVMLSLSTAYSLYVLLKEPYRKYPLLLSSLSTTFVDALLVMGWQYASGGFDSPYFLVVLLATVTVGVRFTPRETFIASLIYSSCYLGLLLLLGDLTSHAVEALIRILYILLSGALGVVISNQILEQVVAKIELQRRLQTEEALARSEAARKEMESRLVVADRMAAVGTLASGVVHEINNPLTFILSNLDWLEEALASKGAPVSPEELRKVVSEAREGAERVRRIVRDLKAFSHVEQEPQGPIDLHRGLEFSLTMAAHEIQPRARLVRDFGVVPPVRGDELRLGQVFLNLLVNAAQAIPEGRPEQNVITVRTGLGGPGQVVVEVSDTGMGMTPEVRGRIFEPFFTTKPAGIGTGLGLSICHGIITGLGGTISVQSEVGRGTTFTVTLPAAEPPSA